jgi:hypothetical protein
MVEIQLLYHLVVLSEEWHTEISLYVNYRSNQTQVGVSFLHRSQSFSRAILYILSSALQIPETTYRYRQVQYLNP